MILGIAFGGAIGALLRYFVGGAVYRMTSAIFPWGTLAINLSGSFLIGFLWEIFERTSTAPEIKTFLLVGILGAYTTFLTFTLETVNLIRDGEIKLALLNMLASNLLGVALVFCGIYCSRMLLNQGH